MGGSGGNGHLCEWVGWGTHTVTRILASFGNLLSRSTHAALSTIENPFFFNTGKMTFQGIIYL